MKILTEWLNEYISLPHNIDELSRDLTQIGLEVDDITIPSRNIQNVVTVSLLDVSTHPNNDNLNICKIDTGNKTVQVITAAENVIPDDVYLWAMPGGELPERTVESEKIAGIESQGMLCSLSELGFSSESRKLLRLPDDIENGVNAQNLLDLKEPIFELDLTPNRSDCLSYLGIARDLSASFNRKLTKPQLSELNNRPGNDVSIEIDVPEKCPAYFGLPVDNIVVRDSRFPIQKRLIKMGIHPQNNVVDVTNHTLLELGHPLHAFDRKKITEPVIIREADDEEEITTLDEINRELSGDDLLISDQNDAIALAGVMGGQKTSVHEGTKSLLVESALFDPGSIRRTSKRQKLSTEASHRFERGVDPMGIKRALKRFSNLLEDDPHQDNLQIYEPVTKDHRSQDRTVISFHPEDFSKLIGFDPDSETMKNRLTKLGCELDITPDHWNVKIPSWRHDLSRAEDIIEEILRLGGYDSIPNQYPMMKINEAPTPDENTIDQIRDFFTSRGFYETINFSFIPGDSHKFSANNEPHRVDNPLSSENKTMRQSILDCLNQNLSRNYEAGFRSLRLFEIGHIFPGNRNHEPLNMGLLATGKKYTEQWHSETRTIDFYDIKGLLNTFFAKLGLPEITFQPNNIDGFSNKKCANVIINQNTIGNIGEIDPEILDAEFEDPVLGFELSVSQLPELESIQFEPYSTQPYVNRDLDLVVDDTKYVGDLKETIFENAKWLEKLTIFDLYRGEPLRDDKKSVSFNLHFRRKDVTLSDEDVNEIQENILDALRNEHNAYLRDE